VQDVLPWLAHQEADELVLIPDANRAVLRVPAFNTQALSYRKGLLTKADFFRLQQELQKDPWSHSVHITDFGGLLA